MALNIKRKKIFYHKQPVADSLKTPLSIQVKHELVLRFQIKTQQKVRNG